MALDSRAYLPSHNNTSIYVFCGSSSSSDHLQTEGGLSSAQVGFHRLAKGNNNNKYFKLEQQAAGHMMHEGIGTLLCHSNDGSFISFEDSYVAAAGAHGYEHNSITIHAECFSNSHHPAVTSLNNLIVAEDGRSHLTGNVKNRDGSLDYWFHSSDAADDHTALHKHPTLDESCMPPNKKQCTSSAITKKSSKTKQPLVSKDPQSIAAKNRRERISERLKILQELVPNGSKVDMVTMLEKAIGYVKFLQLQVKVLAADEFWPVQGGKAPELSQVKDAIDAILSSQRSDRNSTSD